MCKNVQKKFKLKKNYKNNIIYKQNTKIKKKKKKTNKMKTIIFLFFQSFNQRLTVVGLAEVGLADDGGEVLPTTVVVVVVVILLGRHLYV